MSARGILVAILAIGAALTVAGLLRAAGALP